MAGTEGSAHKTFILDGECSVVRTVLEKWGWTESLEKNQFDLRWSCIARKVDGLLLPPRQIVNHFRGSWHLGSKHGLGHCLRQCPGCSMEFFPRQYDLRQANELKEFLEDFYVSEARAQCSKSEDCPIAGRVLERKAAGEQLLRCPHETAELLGKVPAIPSQIESQLRPFLEEYARSLETASCSECCGTASSSKVELPSTNMSATSSQEAFGLGNVWILKPPHLSKGQGIDVRCGLKKILTEAEKRTTKKQRWYCVVQKYLERPLLLPNHTDGALAKVDLRLWIIVISWNPLICFAHPDVYARIATRPFVLDPHVKFETEAHVTNIRDEDNRLDTKTFMSMLGEHRSALFNSRSWPLMLDAVRAALFASRASVIQTSEAYHAAHPNSPSGPTAFELFGFDFGLDSDMHPWLYEANRSPNLLADCEFLREWAEESMESLLSTVLAFHEGKLALPRNSELDAMPGQEGLERLFPPTSMQRGSHTYACYGQEVSKTQPALVAGLDLGRESPCGKWLLIAKERTKSLRIHPPPEASSKSAGKGHSRILCEMLLSTTSRHGDRMIDAQSGCSSMSPISNASPSPKRSSTVSKTLSQPTSPVRTSKLAQLISHLDSRARGSMPENLALNNVSSRLESPQWQSFSCRRRSNCINQSNDGPDAAHGESSPSSDEEAKHVSKTPQPRSFESLRLPALNVTHFPRFPHPRSPGSRGTATQPRIPFHGVLEVSARSVWKGSEEELRDSLPWVHECRKRDRAEFVQELEPSRESFKSHCNVGGCRPQIRLEGLSPMVCRHSMQK